MHCLAHHATGRNQSKVGLCLQVDAIELHRAFIMHSHPFIHDIGLLARYCILVKMFGVPDQCNYLTALAKRH